MKRRPGKPAPSKAKASADNAVRGDKAPTGNSRRAAANAPSHPIDALMERASGALVSMAYFDAERLARKGLTAALAKRDYERMARIVLPLQEARRQIRQLAADACPIGGGVRTINSVVADFPRRPLATGCYLAQPPLTAMDARAIRESAWQRESCVIVLTREPLTRDGQWPMAAVGVGEITVTTRIKVAPPVEVSPEPSSPTRDFYTRLPSLSWFEATLEALGDRAIASLNADDPPAHRVLDLIEFLDACPEHEKLHQALESECRSAATVPEPSLPRRRGPGSGVMAF